MNYQSFKIEKYKERDRNQILHVWEKSVLATHTFLEPIDFEKIKKLVFSIDFNDFEIYCLKNEQEVIGFIGVVMQKIEMLFISPEYIGKGLGRRLAEFAMVKLHADKVDVNEQNLNAVKFYEKLGFISYQRTDKDDLGLDYALLRMKLKVTKKFLQ